MTLCPQTFDAALVKTLRSEKQNCDYTTLYQDDEGGLFVMSLLTKGDDIIRMTHPIDGTVRFTQPSILPAGKQSPVQ